MKSTILPIVAVLILSTSIQAQLSQNPITQPQPQAQPAPVQAPPCTPPEVWKHFHPQSSKPLAKMLARIGKQIDKSTGGTLSGPTMDDVSKTLPPPCPAVPTPTAPKPVSVAAKQ